MVYRKLAIPMTKHGNKKIKKLKWKIKIKKFLILIVPTPQNGQTLKQFVGFCQRIVWMCLAILWGWCLKS